KYPESAKTVVKKFSSELFADAAVEFVKNYDRENPFFLYVAFTAPHDPRQAPAEFRKIYDPAKIDLPPNFMPRHPFDNGETDVRDERLAAMPRSPEEIKQHIADYYAIISHLDSQIGKILDVLEKTGKAENTVIVFAGDNGLAIGQHGLMGKQNLYEHSVRVPLIVSGFGIAENRRSNALCYVSDIFPTLCELTGFKTPAGVDGKSFLPVLKGKSDRLRSEVFLAYRHFMRGVITEDNLKLIKYNVRGEKHTQLFDLNNDPWETANLANKSGFENKKKELTRLLINLSKENHDICDLNKPDWGIPKEKVTAEKVVHFAVEKDIRLLNDAQPKYNEEGIRALVDGLRGTSKFNDRRWVGFEGTDVNLLIDLREVRKIREIRIGFLEDQGAWIFLPEKISLAVSRDGKYYRKISSFNFPKPKINPFFKTIQDAHIQADHNVRFVRLNIYGLKKCPFWHIGAGDKAWVFMDEIIIR
ncbi:MAG: sulfatase-like hydrolase/transferase, partial [Calditrichaeota bacterium]|nr:sulfatase-like hydrolase/transferase [Calditrichota bacterium]